MTTKVHVDDRVSGDTQTDTISEIEISILNIIISGEPGSDLIFDSLTPKDFRSSDNSLIYGAAKRLQEKGEPTDILNLHTELSKTEKTDGGSWSSYLTEIPFIALSINTSNLEFYLRKLKEARILRETTETAYRMYEAAQRGDTERVQKLTEKITELQSQGQADTGAKCIALAHHDPKPKPWVIKGLIPDGFPSMIYGAGGMGKSFLSAYLGIEACRGGQSFMGYSFPREPLNTLIIDYELDVDVQTERARKIARGLNLAEIPENLHYYAPTKAAARALPEFRGLIKRHGIRFAIIDSWGASGVDGGKPEDTTAFLAELRNLGIATLTLDHQAKIQTGENYDNKTAFGSVYKFNMCRSVFQLSKIGASKNPMTLKLRHKKSNFGPLVNDLFLDVCFEGDRVLFTQSNAPNPEDRDLELIGEAIATLKANGVKVNQQALTDYLKEIIARDRLHALLKIGEGGRWETYSGNRKEKLYEPKFLKSGPVYNQDFRNLENDNNDDELPPPPNELF